MTSALCISVAYGALLILPKEILIRITQEDNVYENITAIALFLASFISIYLFLTSRIGNDLFILKTKKNIFFVLLFLLFFFVAGEEISWGQRIFGWGTPKTFGNFNLQDETTIHNLNFIMPIEGRLIYMFIFSWTILVPIFNRTNNKVKVFLQSINLPFGSLWIGFLFCLNYSLLLVVRHYVPFNNGPYGIRREEISECNIAILFLALTLLIFKKERDTNNE
ncbi:MAG: hypothetical protein JJE22_06535 [Bacteroidia bacterium]|nr:hypothetical protein [Bacteroidia bacterium]